MSRMLKRVLLLTALFWSARAFAATPVVDFLPNDVSKSTARAAMSEAVGGSVSLVEADPQMLEMLRWSMPDPGKEACLEKAPALRARISELGLVKPPEDDAELAFTLLEQAAQQILYMDLDAVLESTDTARSMLPCVGVSLSQDQVRSFFLHEAVARIYLEDPKAAETLSDMLAVDHPRVFLETDYPPNVQNAFLDAVKKQMRSQPLKLDSATLQGNIKMDGRSLAELDGVRPGPHVVQAQGPAGPIRTRLISISGKEAADGRVWLAGLINLDLETSVNTRSLLADSLSAQELKAFMGSALDKYLEEKDGKALLFAVKGESGPELRIYKKGTGLSEILPKPESMPVMGGTTPGGEPSTTTRPSANEVNAEKVPPPRSVTASLGFAFHSLAGGGEAFSLNGKSGGYMLRVEYPVGPVLVGARASYMGISFSQSQASGDCGSYTGEGEPTEDQLRAALACVEARAGFGFGLGAAYHLPISSDLRFVPGAYVEGLFLPNTLVQEDGSSASSTLVDVMAVGLMLRARLGYQIAELPSGSRFEFELEPSAGLLVAKPEGSSLLAMPIGFSAGVAMLF